MTLQVLKNSLQAGNIPGLILLYGQEQYFVAEGQKLVIDAVVEPQNRDFNLNRYHGKDFDAAEVLEQAKTFPVFASNRLVIIKDIHDAKADQLETLLSYIENPVPETILLITAEKIDARRKFFQVFKKNGLAIEFKKIYENQLPGFVKGLASSMQVTLTGNALKLFCKRVGANLSEVQGEMDKLVGYLGDRTIAEEEDVAAIVSDTRTESIFDLTDALGRGDVATSIRLLDRLLIEGQPPLMVLAMMTRHFRQIWKISVLLEQNLPQKELPRKIGVSPYFLKGLIDQSHRFGNQQYRQIMDSFLKTDLALKSSGAEPRSHLERLIFDIAAYSK